MRHSEERPLEPSLAGMEHATGEDLEIEAGLNHVTHARIIGKCGAKDCSGNIEEVLIPQLNVQCSAAEGIKVYNPPRYRRYCTRSGCTSVVTRGRNVPAILPAPARDAEIERPSLLGPPMETNFDFDPRDQVGPAPLDTE